MYLPWLRAKRGISPEGKIQVRKMLDIRKSHTYKAHWTLAPTINNRVIGNNFPYLKNERIPSLTHLHKI